MNTNNNDITSRSFDISQPVEGEYVQPIMSTIEPSIINVGSQEKLLTEITPQKEMSPFKNQDNQASLIEESMIIQSERKAKQLLRDSLRQSFHKVSSAKKQKHHLH
jgi:hypothetical protein